MVPPDLLFVHNAKALTFIGQKKIEAMPVEVAEEEVGVVSVELQQNRRYEDARGTKTVYGV